MKNNDAIALFVLNLIQYEIVTDGRTDGQRVRGTDRQTDISAPAIPAL